MPSLTQPLKKALGREPHRSGSALEIAGSNLGHEFVEVKRRKTIGSLDTVITQGLMTQPETVALTVEALRVVSELRQVGLDAHGDIRPRNILIDRKHHTGAIAGFHATPIGEQALAAIGIKLSHIADAGSPGDDHDLSFTAPEVVMGAEPDSRSDVYEGARTLLHALTGERPGPTVRYFDDEAGNPLEPVPAPDLSTDFPVSTPDPVRFALQQALSPDPAERQSMRQLVEEVSGVTYPWVAPPEAVAGHSMN